MRIVNKIKEIIKVNRFKKPLRTFLLLFVQITFIFSTYNVLFLGFLNTNQVEAATSTEGYYDCGTSWPTYYNGEECYIRGTYLTQSGWNSDAQCWMTNRIVYPDTGQLYYFCDPQRTAQLSNKEVIGFVRWHGDGTFNIVNMVELAETFNQPPNQPGMIRPQSGWEMGPRNNGAYAGVNCSTAGTGQGCSVDFVTSSYDPDFYQWIELQAQIARNEGGNRSYNQTLASNGQTYTRTQTLNDGHWNFRARNCDTAAECSGYTGARTFTVDTTAPTGISMNLEPEFTTSTQNTVSSTVGSDNVVGGIQYEFQVDDDPTFTSPDNSSGWVSINSFTFAGLTDETTYYYRVRARDRLYNNGSWSPAVFSSQDAIAPQIQNISITNERISPQNNDGYLDDTTISFEWIEKYSENTRLEVLDSGNNIVKTITDLLPIGSITPLPHQFVWDGKDNSNNLVIDGPYTLRIVVRDLAGNETSDDSKVVIVDNIPADINVSTPSTGSWFNNLSITINGQTEVDAIAGITNNQTAVSIPLSLTSLGLFSHSDVLNMGANSFTLFTEDTAKNTKQVTVNYYREEFAPSINSIYPDGSSASPSETIIKNRRPEITLDLSDTGYTDSLPVIPVDYISGIDPNSIFISLTHPSNGELVLVNGGVNTQPSLGNIQETCSVPGTFGNSTAPNCTYKFVFSADLTPDGIYTITSKAKDKAGNSAIDKTQSFELDTNIRSDLSSPSNGNLFNYSKITLTGTTEKNSEVTISLPLGDIDGNGNVDTETFVVSDSASNSARVTVNNCRASISPSTDGIKEICDWEVSDFQLERDTVNPGNVSNQIKIDTKDNIDIYPSAGLNTKSETISVNVDLFAVTLALNTDTEYFSPNGDGKQDGVNFTDISTNGQIETYSLEIKDSVGNTVKSFSAGGTPPSSIPWDGRNNSGDFVVDGTYTYQLIITTTDGINFQTTPIEIYAVTSLTDTVIITNPKNNSFSSRGVITVQGQAPQTLVESQSSDLKVKICIDTVAMSGTCDTEYYTTVDSNGLFSTVVMLPRVNSQDEHYLTATALDKYGNETPPSNQVKVTTTSNLPFESVQIIPVLTGTNSPEAYQIILEKLDNGEEITQEDIDSLRTVIMRANVYQGTERVKFFFADHSQVNELPSTTDWNSIGYITGDNKTNLYKGFTDGTTPYTTCNSTICTWDFYYPLPSNLSGLYEVRFEGKLDVEVENLTAGFTVDGNIPAAPIILDINKVVGGSVFNTNYYGGTFYSNNEVIQIKGAADPNASIEVKDDSGNTICTTTASAIGIWSCNVDISTIPAYGNPDSNVYTIPLITYATLGLNTVESVDNKTVVVDKIAPIIEQLNTATEWRKSGDVVDLNVVANEDMGYAISIDEQDPADPDQCVNSSATFDLHGISIPVQLGAIDDLIVSSSNLGVANGSLKISGYAVEGRYCTTTRISDLAGNTAERGIQLFIDNTDPNIPSIDVTDWGQFNGIKTKTGYVAKGRLVPEFVHEENQVKIKAWGEENTKLEFYVNAKLVMTSDLITTSSGGQAGTCTQSLATDKITDSVNVEDKDICSYEFTYPLTVNGKDHVFQVKSIDRAGNKSIIAENEVVYYDNQKPINPEVLRTFSPSYNPTPGWMLGIRNSLTKDLSITLKTHAESLSDLEFTTTGPAGFNNYIFTQTPGNQVKDQEIKLGSTSDDRDGCVKMVDTRRTGICEDGNYTIAIKSTDAAGNPSGITKHVVERDTVRPEAPTITVSKSGGMGNEALGISISGEKNSTAVITISEDGRMSRTITGNLGNDGIYSSSNLIGTLNCGNIEYVVVVRLYDRARNVSTISSGNITTGDCPTCSNGGKLALPVRPDYIVTSEFRTPERPTHEGLDMIRKGGDSYRADIYATGAGQIVRSTRTGGEQWGKANYVTLKHDDGKIIEYWHLDNESSDNDPIGIGQRAGTMTVLGHMGKTGESTGVHLHFGVYIAGSPVNPKYYIGDKEDPACAMEVSADADKSIELKESQLGGANKDGAIHDWCGTKVQDYFSIGNHGDSIIMYNPNNKQAYLITGGIWETYWKNGACSEFGYPKMDEEKTGRLEGWYQFFDKANIYWSKDRVKSQPGIVKGYIRDYYENKGGTWSYLGFPENKEWDATSTCGTTGTHQNFTSGKIYASQIGHADWEYGGGFLNLQGDTIKHYWDLGEMNGELGWPKSGSYRKSTDNIYLENGEIYQTGIFDTGVNHKIYGGCSDVSQRKNDPDNYATKLIQAKENTFTSYQRVNGGNGNGAVHQWTCGGNTMWLTDYDKIGEHRSSVIIANENLNKAFLLTGEIWNKYRDNNGCFILKKPTADEFDTGIHKTWLWKSGTSLRQTFESGDIYSFATFNLIGQETRHTYTIYGNIKTKYDSNSGINGSYRFLKSDRYSYNENDVKTFCQDSEGGRICENDIPALTDEQKKLGELLGRFVSKGEIKDQCSLRVVSIDDGVAYYDNGVTGKITGNIYRKWQPACNTYGKPVSSIQSISSKGMEGAFQRFQFNNWERVYDFYDSNTDGYGTVVLEGWQRDMFNSKGFDRAGFPKSGTFHAQSDCKENAIMNGVYMDTQRGRIYRYDKNGGWNWFVKRSEESNVGRYYFENGGHQKFGLPTSDEYKTGFLGSISKQDFEMGSLYHPLFGGVKTDPEEIICQVEDPVVPVPTATPVPTDPKEAECQAKGMIKYVNPNDPKDVVCAKINLAPYINQALDENGKYKTDSKGEFVSYDPSQGWVMCGANATLMALGQQGLLEKTDYSSLKEYVYKTDPVDTTDTRRCEEISSTTIKWGGKDVILNAMSDVKGVYSYTGLPTSNCKESAWDYIATYLKGTNKIEISRKEGQTLDYQYIANIPKNTYMNYIKESVDNGGGVIQGYSYPATMCETIPKSEFGHINLIIGYSVDANNNPDRVIVNDSYTNLMRARCDWNYDFSGKGAIYNYENKYGVEFIRILTFKLK